MFMSMFNDIDWTKSGNSDVCISSAREVVWKVQLQVRRKIGPASQSND